MARRYAFALAVAGGILVLSAASSMAAWGGYSESPQSGETMQSGTDTPASPEMKSPDESMGTQEEPGTSDTMKSGHEMEPAIETGAPPENTENESRDPAATEY